jgi:tetratricopeptide (TPR) repeat protein
VTRQNYVAHHQLGLHVQGAGDLAAAKAHYLAALAIHPKMGGALGNLAVVQVHLGERAEARQRFEELVALEPEGLQGRLGLATLALQENRPAEVVGLLSDVRPGPRGFELAMLNLAEAHERLGEWRAAAESYERSFAGGVNDPTAAAALAWILATGPDPALLDGARALEFAARAAAGGAPNALEVSAAAHARAGDFERAVALQEQLLGSLRDPMQRFLQEQRLKLYRSAEPYTRK